MEPPVVTLVPSRPLVPRARRSPVELHRAGPRSACLRIRDRPRGPTTRRHEPSTLLRRPRPQHAAIFTNRLAPRPLGREAVRVVTTTGSIGLVPRRQSPMPVACGPWEVAVRSHGGALRHGQGTLMVYGVPPRDRELTSARPLADLDDDPTRASRRPLAAAKLIVSTLIVAPGQAETRPRRA